MFDERLRRRMFAGAVAVVGCLLAVLPVRGGAEPVEALATGWHDEMNRGATARWTWAPPRGRADLSAPQPGTLRLRLGDASESGQIPGPTPRAYYWASVYRYLRVDLDRYPILAVRAVRVGGNATWWDAILQEYTGGAGHGPETRASLADARVPGLLLFDVPAETHLTGKKRLRLRLNVAGLEPGGKADYSNVRIIRLEDNARLREAPDLQDVALRP
jgi:hypothetical protein